MRKERIEGVRADVAVKMLMTIMMMMMMMKVFLELRLVKARTRRQFSAGARWALLNR